MRALFQLSFVASIVLSGAACAPNDPASIDGDADGVPLGEDCDDTDPFVFPGALEHCNGRDDDCDGVVDNGASSATTLWYLDDDGDGFGDPETATRSCRAPADHIATGEDCDDADPSVHPGQSDGCDGIDTDCDGIIDETPDSRNYLDADGDGFGGPSLAWVCVGAGGTATPDDCDDTNAEANPAASERCNGFDDDCDGFADDLDPEGVEDPKEWFADVDLDGYGDAEASVFACEAPTGNVAAVAGDCNDDDAFTYPGAAEACEPVDRNCDGVLPDASAWWSDSWPVRLPLEVVSDVDRGAPVLSITLDVGLVAGTSFDARTLALVVQDCEGEGAVRLDAEFTDGLGGVFDGAATLPLDDGIGGVHAVLDRALVAGEPLPLALYALGPIASTPGLAEATSDALATGSVTLSIDRVEGGGADLSIDALDDDGALLEGQVASASPDGGAEGAAGSLLPGLAVTEVVASDGMVAALDVITPYAPADAADAALERRIRWVAFSGRPELYGWVDTTVVEAGSVTRAASLGFGAGAQRDDAVAATDPVASWSTPVAHVGFDWLNAPPVGASAVQRGSTLWLEGTESALPLADAPAGAILVDRRLFAVRAEEGPLDEAALLDVLAGGVDVVVGSAESR